MEGCWGKTEEGRGLKRWEVSRLTAGPASPSPSLSLVPCLAVASASPSTCCATPVHPYLSFFLFSSFFFPSFPISFYLSLRYGLEVINGSWSAGRLESSSEVQKWAWGWASGWLGFGLGMRLGIGLVWPNAGMGLVGPALGQVL
eukprot:TRINITY_DN663_c4_g1_i1.p1 TRINITY_DN663_c4_g1~~TRINITY_DN663_c4_g1_i1.p1  ORF type:complete len:144 (+),score=23.90 TRINITY_DN663_c4_g1_i1:277-708(+)